MGTQASSLVAWMCRDLVRESKEREVGSHIVLIVPMRDMLACELETTRHEHLALHKHVRLTSLENTCILRYKMKECACANNALNVLGIGSARRSLKRVSMCLAT